MWQDPHSTLAEVVAVGQVWVSDVALLMLRLFKGTFQREEPFCSSGGEPQVGIGGFPCCVVGAVWLGLGGAAFSWERRVKAGRVFFHSP